MKPEPGRRAHKTVNYEILGILPIWTGSDKGGAVRIRTRI
jgi:hypothetical protein